MSTVSHIKDEFNELKQMPYFWGRLVCFSVLFAFDDLAVTHFQSPYLFHFIGVLVIFFFPALVMQILALKKADIKLKMSAPLFLWLVLGCIATVNEVCYGLLHGVTPIYQGVVFWLFIPALVYFGKEKGFYKLFLLSCAAPILFNIISGFVLYPFRSNNMFALAITGFLPVLLVGIVWFLKKKCFAASLVCFILSAATVFLSYTSLCRTSFVAIIIIIFAFSIIVSISELCKMKNVRFKERTLSIVSFSLVILLVLTIIFTIVYIETEKPTIPDELKVHYPDSMINKFLYSLQTQNLLSNRYEIWEYTFKRISAIGNGPFFYMGDAGYFHSHNSFIAVLAHYGIVPFILYCIYFVWVFASSIKYCFRGKILQYLPFTMISTYFICSITEDLACIVVPRMFSVLFFFVCALLINEYPKATSRP